MHSSVRITRQHGDHRLQRGWKTRALLALSQGRRHDGDFTVDGFADEAFQEGVSGGPARLIFSTCTPAKMLKSTALASVQLLHTASCPSAMCCQQALATTTPGCRSNADDPSPVIRPCGNDAGDGCAMAILGKGAFTAVDEVSRLDDAPAQIGMFALNPSIHNGDRDALACGPAAARYPPSWIARHTGVRHTDHYTSRPARGKT